MATPISSLNITTPAPSRPSTRKRSRSTPEIFTLSTPCDTKRARIGIQELTTDSRPRTLLPAFSRPSSSSGPETESQGEENSSSSLEDSLDESLSSSDESSSESVVDKGYDSDTESGSTTTSSSSSSSDEGSGDGEDGSSRSATIGFPSPEQTRLPVFGGGTGSTPSALAKRLNAFLPQMAAANAQLDEEREKGLLTQRNIEDVDENSRYIEMNLGLGVLEEKLDTTSHGSDNDGDESEAGSGKSWTKGRTKKHDAMSVLMGKKAAKKPQISVMD